MDSLHVALTSEELLAHERFVRSIARGLLPDADAARDVAQDTWIKALGAGPRLGSSLRSWLGTIARNRAADVGRAHARRSVRERRAARPEAIEPVDVTYERLAVQREVVSAILELDEPYKSVVILRYYHDLAPAQIAQRLGSKPATVRTQLVRAHAQLKAKLDVRYRDRSAWVGLLLPLATRATVRWVPVSIGAALLLAGGVGAVAWAASQHGESTELAAAPGETRIVNIQVPGSIPDAERESYASASNEPVDAAAAEPEQHAVASERVVELLHPRATLLDREKYGYANAAFSFERGIGGEAAERKTHNDWDVVLGRQSLNAVTVVDDQSLIVDLGSLHLVDLCKSPMESLESAVRHAAEQRFARERDDADRAFQFAPVNVGNTYFVWTQDGDSDLAALCEVVEHVPQERCVLEWYATEDGQMAQCSIRSSDGVRTLAAAALDLRRAARSVLLMKSARVLLQVRCGAMGGNPGRIDMAGRAMAYIDRVQFAPLDLVTPPAIEDDALAYFEGGYVPDDQKLVVTRVTWRGEAHGDSNGHGYLRVVLGGKKLVDAPQSPDPIDGSWTGRVEIRPGDEAASYLEISNSSWGEAIFEGAFEPLGD